jgi:excisionase family DNA binding protein
MNEDTPMKLLTLPQVAKLLQISESFAYRLAQNGEIPAVRMGRSVRVRPVDLERYIEKRVDSSQFVQ